MYCGKHYGSIFFRKHVVEFCKQSRKDSPTKRNELVNVYYDSNSNDTNNESEIQSFSDSNESSIRNESESCFGNNNPDCHSESDSSNPITLDNALKEYEKWLASPISGRSRFKEATKSNDLNVLKQVIRLGCIDRLEDFIDVSKLENILKRIEDHQVQDGSRFVYAVAVEHFLNFCQWKNVFNGSDVSRSVLAWSNAKNDFKKGREAERSKRKRINPTGITVVNFQHWQRIKKLLSIGM